MVTRRTRHSGGMIYLVIFACVGLVTSAVFLGIQHFQQASAAPVVTSHSQHCVVVPDEVGRYHFDTQHFSCGYTTIFAAEHAAQTQGDAEVGTFYTAPAYEGDSLTFAAFRGQRCSQALHYSFDRLTPLMPTIGSLTTNPVIGCKALYLYPAETQQGHSLLVQPNENVGALHAAVALSGSWSL